MKIWNRIYQKYQSELSKYAKKKAEEYNRLKNILKMRIYLRMYQTRLMIIFSIISGSKMKLPTFMGSNHSQNTLFPSLSLSTLGLGVTLLAGMCLCICVCVYLYICVLVYSCICVFVYFCIFRCLMTVKTYLQCFHHHWRYIVWETFL